MSEIAIRVQNLSKQYKIGVAKRPHDTLRDHVAEWAKSLLYRNGRTPMSDTSRSAVTGQLSPDDYILALKDVSFDVEEGEIVGIIGRNGAGKSTLLKILSRITDPTGGRAELYGRVGSLLEVGTGFHPELTGRENIYLNGSVLGMSKAEITKKFDEIVAFAEVERFIDTPVKRYSSGMYVRLAFAVAAHLEPEILIVDEVLAVGDTSFQRKCLGKMGDVARHGRTILFVSHNMGAVQALCNRGLFIKLGQLAFDGPVDEAARVYLQGLSSSAEDPFAQNPERSGTGSVRLIAARLLDSTNEPSAYTVAGEKSSLEFTYKNADSVRRVKVIATVFNYLGIPVSNFDMELTNFLVHDLGDEGKFLCHIPSLPLPPGEYRVAVALESDGSILDLLPNALLFKVTSSKFFPSGRIPNLKSCTCMIQHEWEHEITATPSGS
jgi:lipopolysaccharide transport system ATP-binding protein